MLIIKSLDSHVELAEMGLSERIKPTILPAPRMPQRQSEVVRCAKLLPFQKRIPLFRVNLWDSLVSISK